MQETISFRVRDQMVKLAGACFWYWNSLYHFFESSGVPKSLYARYPRESFNKYDVMRNVLREDLALVLDGTLPLADIVRAKVDAIVRYGNIDFRARDIRTGRLRAV